MPEGSCMRDIRIGLGKPHKGCKVRNKRGGKGRGGERRGEEGRNVRDLRGFEMGDPMPKGSRMRRSLDCLCARGCLECVQKQSPPRHQGVSKVCCDCSQRRWTQQAQFVFLAGPAGSRCRHRCMAFRNCAVLLTLETGRLLCTAALMSHEGGWRCKDVAAWPARCPALDDGNWEPGVHNCVMFGVLAIGVNLSRRTMWVVFLTFWGWRWKSLVSWQ
eukprot:scaffold37187_cov18-Tisochrysis_lutea.AAC.1